MRNWKKETTFCLQRYCFDYCQAVIIIIFLNWVISDGGFWVYLAENLLSDLFSFKQLKQKMGFFSHG